MRHFKTTAAVPHVAPFAAWVLLMLLPGVPPAWSYVLRTLAGAVLILVLRPWENYPRLAWSHVPPALLVGVAVFALWIIPESPWFAQRFTHAHAFYLRYGVTGDASPVAGADSPFSPQVGGWPIALVRLAGSACVIATIEEFFWRGFLYRWIQKPDFLSVDLGRFHAAAFAIVVVVFAVEHHRWAAGAIAGVAYGLAAVRTRDIWTAVLAHVVTNGLLGVYVLATGSYAFW